MNSNRQGTIQRRLLSLIVALVLTNANAAEESIRYAQIDPFTIKAVINGEHHIAERLSTENFGDYEASVDERYGADQLFLVAQGDWENSGFPQALVAASTAGNCCPNKYLLISYTPSVGFRTQALFEAWQDPIISKAQLDDWSEQRWIFTTIENNEGFNTLDFKQRRQRYVMEDGMPVLVDTLEDIEISAIKEIRSHQVERMLHDPAHLNTQQTESVGLISYDLNKDGQNDETRGYFWERWGRMRFFVKWAAGTRTEIIGQCKRIGILESVTEGAHDLVCDNSDRYIWNGQTYEPKPNTAFDLTSQD